MLQRKAYRVGGGRVFLHAYDLGTVGHHVACRHVVQLEDVGDHLLLAFVYQIVLLHVVHEREHILLCYVGLGREPQRLEHQLRGSGQRRTQHTGGREAAFLLYAALRPAKAVQQHGQRGQRRQAQKRPPGSLCKNAKKAVNKKSARKHKCRAKPGHPVGKTKDAALLPLRFACGHCARAVSRRKRAKRGSCCDEDTKTIRVHLKKTPSFRPPPERGP